MKPTIGRIVHYHRPNWLVDHRPHYDKSWAITNAQTAPSELAAFAMARRMAREQGCVFYVHESQPDFSWKKRMKVYP